MLMKWEFAQFKVNYVVTKFCLELYWASGISKLRKDEKKSMQSEFCSGSSRWRSSRSVGCMGMVNGVVGRFPNGNEPESLIPASCHQIIYQCTTASVEVQSDSRGRGHTRKGGEENTRKLTTQLGERQNSCTFPSVMVGLSVGMPIIFRNIWQAMREKHAHTTGGTPHVQSVFGAHRTLPRES